ncbi:MAG: M48 family metallopeptidase [Acidobacteriaceae bacterium]
MRSFTFSPHVRSLAISAFAAFAFVAAQAQTTTPAAQTQQQPAAAQSAPASTAPTSAASSAPASAPAANRSATAQTTAPATAQTAPATASQTTSEAAKPEAAKSGPAETTQAESNKKPASAPSLPPAKTPTAAEVASITPTGDYTGDQTMPGVKKGSIEDVNAVGERNIGGRGLGNWYSTDTEIKIGKQYADEVEKSSHIITDPVVAEYVNRIGQNIVKNSDCKVPFTIKVIDSDEINAFALPGGFFFVNSGLILAADSEAELAAVMAHETAHVCAHHAMREMTRMNIAQIASMVPMVFIGGWTGYGIYEASSIAIPVTFMKFSRDFEAQADYLGIEYMYRAGYDPEAMITFFEKIEDLQKHKPGAVAKVFSDHPQTPDRIEKSQEEIARILPPRPEYLETTSEFDQVKARLARIENKRRLHGNRNAHKPSLRRVDNNPNNPNGGDETPTLHRRGDDQNPANTTN